MKKYINKSLIAVIALSALFIASCNKDDVNEGITNKEKTIIKLPQASEELYSIALDATPGVTEVQVLEIRKDAISQSELNLSQNVVISKNSDLIDAYNDANQTEYEEFSGFTVGDGATYDGNTWTVPFAAGDFVKFITLKFDPTTLDLTKKYALGFSIAEPGGTSVASAAYKDVLVEIAIKNEYHGTYEAVGVFHHPTAGDREINELKLLSTSGPKSVIANLGDLGSSGYKMMITVNADNTVTLTPAGVTPDIDQHWGPNYYDPITKEFHLHYSYNTSAPRIVEETLSPQ